MKSSTAVTAGALALAFSASAIAASLPDPQTQNGVTFLSGGIGSDEAQAMKAEAKHYPLSIVMSEGRHDAYVANAKVSISDKAGRMLLDAVSEGPILLVKLPAGRYRVSAMADGKTLERDIHVGTKGGRQVVFHWKKIA